MRLFVYNTGHLEMIVLHVFNNIETYFIAFRLTGFAEAYYKTPKMQMPLLHAALIFGQARLGYLFFALFFITSGRLDGALCGI